MYPDSHRDSIPPFQGSLFASTEMLSRIGTGFIGGKAEGLASVRDTIWSDLSERMPAGVRIGIPRLTVIATDAFDAFMERNGLYEIALSDLPDDRLAHAFQKADLPSEILGDLRRLSEEAHSPLAVRSSSLLEDALYRPFAGVYETKMIPNNRPDGDTRFQRLAEAIKFVYASTFLRGARTYRKVIGQEDEDEKMAVILQELLGGKARRPLLSPPVRRMQVLQLLPYRQDPPGGWRGESRSGPG